jgi:transcriptional regulator of heat shock response
VPTEAGYRLYVDVLLKVRPPAPQDREQIEKVAHGATGFDALLESTAHVLHSLSHHAGVVTTPRPMSDPVRQIEFVRLRENRVIVVFVSEATSSTWPSIDTMAFVETAPAFQPDGAPAALARSLPEAVALTRLVQATSSVATSPKV